MRRALVAAGCDIASTSATVTKLHDMQNNEKNSTFFAAVLSSLSAVDGVQHLHIRPPHCAVSCDCFSSVLSFDALAGMRQTRLVALIVAAVLLSLALVFLGPSQPALVRLLQPQPTTNSNEDRLAARGVVHRNVQVDHVQGGAAGLVPGLDYGFTWSIYITPQGFVGGPARAQRRAIESWLRLTVCVRPSAGQLGHSEEEDREATGRGRVEGCCYHRAPSWRDGGFLAS